MFKAGMRLNFFLPAHCLDPIAGEGSFLDLLVRRAIAWT
jgi:hypothetical protein